VYKENLKMALNGAGGMKKLDLGGLGGGEPIIENVDGQE
jgi:hypothetical protein